VREGLPSEQTGRRGLPPRRQVFPCSSRPPLLERQVSATINSFYSESDVKRKVPPSVVAAEPQARRK